MKKKPTSLPNDREAVVLAALLHGERYGLEIRDDVGDRTGISLPFGSLYVTLDRMENKGFIQSRMAESTAERGGGRRRYFKITGAGVRALNALREAISSPHGGLANA